MSRYDPRTLPANIRRCLPADNPLSVAAASMLTSDTGSPSKADVRAEKALQDEFEGWLCQHDYQYRREPMHKATMAPPGWPDFTVNLPGGRVCYIEYKTAAGKLSPEQTAWHRRAQECGIPVFTSRSLQFSIYILRQLEKNAEATPRHQAR